MILFRVLVLCAVCASMLRPAAALEVAGTVERLHGTATATSSKGLSRPLQAGSSILVGDSLATGSNARLRLRMTDGAVLTLGYGSGATIDAYSPDETAGQAIVNVSEGIFEVTSGVIATLGPGRFLIATPTAILSILGYRGTDVWGQQIGDRLGVVMLSGTAVQVTTPDGSVDLNTPDTGVDLAPDQAPPPPVIWSPDTLSAARAATAFE